MPRRIMIVEDQEIVALHVRAVLEDAGYTVVGHADNKADALALADRHKPSVALVDIDIRGDANGLETAMELGSRYRMPVLFLTGRGDFLVRAMALPIEPLGYVAKPFLPETLLEPLAKLDKAGRKPFTLRRFAPSPIPHFVGVAFDLLQLVDELLEFGFFPSRMSPIRIVAAISSSICARVPSAAFIVSTAALGSLGDDAPLSSRSARPRRAQYDRTPRGPAEDPWSTR